MTIHQHSDEHSLCDCDFPDGWDTCTCGHNLNRHDMGHGCIECRCLGYVDTATARGNLT